MNYKHAWNNIATCRDYTGFKQSYTRGEWEFTKIHMDTLSDCQSIRVSVHGEIHYNSPITIGLRKYGTFFI